MSRKKANCWEVMRCGREPGGARFGESGTCPAAIATRLDGVNDGIAGGRACWCVPNTDCSEAADLESVHQCLSCPFLQRVKEEQGEAFVFMSEAKKPIKERPTGKPKTPAP